MYNINKNVTMALLIFFNRLVQNRQVSISKSQQTLFSSDKTVDVNNYLLFLHDSIFSQMTTILTKL